jgi:hypothetical protein
MPVFRRPGATDGGGGVTRRRAVPIVLMALALVALMAGTALAAYALNAERWWNGTTAGQTYASKSRVAMGDVNGDGKSDVVNLYDRGSGRAYVYAYVSGGGSSFSRVTYWSGNWPVAISQVAAGDFDRDGKADLFVLRDLGSGHVGLYMMKSSGSSFASPALQWSGSFAYSRCKLSTGDCDGDGKSEPVVLYESGSGKAAIYVMRPPGARVNGQVVSASTGAALSGISVAFTPASGPAVYVNTGSDGSYSVVLPAGTYTAAFSATDYMPATYGAFTVSGTGRSLETIRLVPLSAAGAGGASGTIRSALTGLGVGGLTIGLRQGYNVTSGPYISGGTAPTASDGTYSFPGLAAGYYTAEITGTGYITTTYLLWSIAGTAGQGQDAVVSPNVAAGQVRIVLTWGETPRDLDSHFTGPNVGASGRFHVYYSSKTYTPSGASSPVATLDIDDTSSFGPETTTLYSSASGGLYRFSVHDYTNKNLTSSLGLANSGAQVKVYTTAGLVATFNVPRATGGTLWTVFTMTNGAITPVNTMSYQSSSSAVQ